MKRSLRQRKFYLIGLKNASNSTKRILSVLILSTIEAFRLRQCQLITNENHMIGQSKDKIRNSSGNSRSTQRKEHQLVSQLKNSLKVKKISSRKSKTNSFPRKIKKEVNQKNHLRRLLQLPLLQCMLQLQMQTIILILLNPNIHQNNLQLILLHLIIILPQQ